FLLSFFPQLAQFYFSRYTNGLLRQFFPKGTSFANVSDDDLQRVVDLINNRPRKRLNFLTPFEVLQEFFL
uniref:transposase n=1 Tax=uncultured Ruminococcus sp. TaxID=165186 RepID=UPI0034A5180B